MASVLAATGKAAFTLAYQTSPILLTGGIAAGIPGGTLPIVAITQAANFILGLLNGASPLDQNQYFAQFKPLPGSTLIDWDIGKYPFANQVIAANSMIQNERKLSMLMQCPANQPGAYVSKLATISALVAALNNHINLGGTFTVATPSYIWQNLVLLKLFDVTANDTHQVQAAFQFDFWQPLLTLAQANSVAGNLLSKIGTARPVNSTSWSGATVQ